ncbi:uncharacterized protein LOC112271172 isoform X2 [Brachypodium distachyon]|uniref:uncharacterized protein LOC112271172 isoform X2 n=1 Tax=Brachypodium distachyon TaxID=15368 RepID=UPI000D0DECD6|nr:uncharacterized protein LOC112271172 isoform X2 [Brachypodium distachyon]|eukprot:XP_024316019.1 uncharacterized protein LOC112271172 isoform X2 [Brachypodium distachyon]
MTPRRRRRSWCGDWEMDAWVGLHDAGHRGHTDGHPCAGNLLHCCATAGVSGLQLTAFHVSARRLTAGGQVSALRLTVFHVGRGENGGEFNSQLDGGECPRAVRGIARHQIVCMDVASIDIEFRVSVARTSSAWPRPSDRLAPAECVCSCARAAHRRARRVPPEQAPRPSAPPTHTHTRTFASATRDYPRASAAPSREEALPCPPRTCSCASVSPARRSWRRCPSTSWRHKIVARDGLFGRQTTTPWEWTRRPRSSIRSGAGARRVIEEVVEHLEVAAEEAAAEDDGEEDEPVGGGEDPGLGGEACGGSGWGSGRGCGRGAAARRSAGWPLPRRRRTNYTIAILVGAQNTFGFNLHRSRSETMAWTRTTLQLGAIDPPPGYTYFSHHSDKAIALGGGFVGWATSGAAPPRDEERKEIELGSAFCFSVLLFLFVFGMHRVRTRTEAILLPLTIEQGSVTPFIIR